MDQRNCIKFCVQNYIKYARIFEIFTLVFDESTIANHKFNCGIPGLRKVEKMSMTMLVKQ